MVLEFRKLGAPHLFILIEVVEAHDEDVHVAISGTLSSGSRPAVPHGGSRTRPCFRLGPNPVQQDWRV